MKKQLYVLACITLSMTSLTAFDSRKVFNHKDRESQFMFLEKAFITDVYGDIQNIWTHLQALVPAACAAIAGYHYCNTKDSEIDAYRNILEKFDATEVKRQIDINALTKANDEKNPTIDPTVYLAIATISATIVGIQGLQCYINYYTHRQTVANFMKSWNLNRPYTPVEYHHVFDALASIMDMHGDEAVLAHATEIVDIMQFMIMRHFTSRYEAALQIEAIDNMGTTQSILDCIKASFDVKSNLIA